MLPLILQIAYFLILPFLLIIAAFIIVRSFCLFRNIKTQRNSKSSNGKSETKSRLEKKGEEDSVSIEMVSDDTFSSSYSYSSEKKQCPKHIEQDLNLSSKYHLEIINESEILPNFNAAETIVKTESSEAFVQTENFERNIGVQADIVPKIYFFETHRNQYVQTDFGVEKFQYDCGPIKRNDCKVANAEKKFSSFPEPPLTDISTLHCNPVEKKNKSTNISSLEERAYRLSRWLSEDKDGCKSDFELTCLRPLPNMAVTRRNAYKNYSIPSIPNYFENNRNIQKYYSPEDNYSNRNIQRFYNPEENYSVSNHIRGNCFDALQTSSTPIIPPHQYIDAAVQTEQIFDNSSNFIPSFKLPSKTTANLRRHVNKSPVLFDESPQKQNDYEFQKRMLGKTRQLEKIQTATKVKQQSPSSSSPDNTIMKRTVYEIARRLEKKSPTPVSPIKKFFQNTLQKHQSEKEQNYIVHELKASSKFPSSETQWDKQNKKDHEFNKVAITGQNESVKQPDRLQSQVQNKYSSEQMEIKKLYSEYADGEQDVLNIKTTEAYPKIKKDQDSTVGYGKTDYLLNPLSQAKYDLQEIHVKSDQIADSTNIKTRSVETGDNFGSEENNVDTVTKTAPIRVKKKFSSYLKGQYRNLEDETVGKSYMMMQDLKEVLQKRGIAN